VPAGIPADTRQYLETIAAAGDARREQLGADTVAEAPRWALDTLGPVPEELGERLGWQHKAGVIAAHRELSGHDDPDIPLGAAPPPGLVEAHASWSAAWQALGRPAGDDEGAMSDGQLRMRVRAYEREQAWAPRQVSNELAGTIQARDHQRGFAIRLGAEADAAPDEQVRERLRREAAQAGALADTLDTGIAQLEQLDHERGLWLAHTAGTRAAYDRARQELLNRRALDEQPETHVTAAGWMAAHDQAMREEDTHRPITDEADLTGQDTSLDEACAADDASHDGAGGPVSDADTDTETDAEASRRDERDRRTGAQVSAEVSADTGAEAGPASAEHNPPERVASAGLPADLREIAMAEPAPADEHTVREPSAEEIAESVRRAQRALDEITAREGGDQDRLDAERAFCLPEMRLGS